MAVQEVSNRIEYLDGELPDIGRVCVYCCHHRKFRSCDAYPEEAGIPVPIWLGENNHQEPYLGDHGIQFEPVDTPYLRQKFPEYFEGEKLEEVV